MDHLEKRKQEIGKFQDSDMRRTVIMKVKNEIRGHKEAMLNREKDDIYETAYENLTKELIYTEPIRRTANYQETLFGRTIEGNPMIDKAYKLVSAA